MKRLLALLCLVPLLALTAVACDSDDDEASPVDGTESEQVGQASDDQAELPLGPSGAEDSPVFQHLPAEPGGTIIVGQVQQPASLYLYASPTLAAAHVLNAIYDGPIESYDYESMPVILVSLPSIGTEGSGAIKQLVDVAVGDSYVDAKGEVKTAEELIPGLPQIVSTFTIREGVAWQDGTPVTAADSVFSQNLACDEASPTSKVLCDRTASYEAVDERTVQWTGLPGYEHPVYATAFYAPLPRHQENSFGERMDELTAEEIQYNATFTRHPLSYGPFQVDDWVDGEDITLTRNESYWRSGEGLPYLDGVQYKFFADSGALLDALLSGEVDVATRDGLDVGQAEVLDQAQGNGQVTASFVAGSGFEHIDFNLLPGDDRPAFGACHEFRRAITMGTDRQQMVDEVLKGLTKVQHSFVSPDHWASPSGDNAVIHPYDPEQAMELLDELGFTDEDEDGVREAAEEIVCAVLDADGNSVDQVIPAGTPLELTLLTTTGDNVRQQSMLVFQENMKDIGVKVVLEFEQPDRYFSESEDAPLSGRLYDLAEFAWMPGLLPPAGLYMCDEIPSADNEWTGKNSTGWCDPEYDETAMKAETTLDRAEATALYGEAQKRFAESLPVIPLYAPVHVMATAPNVVNFAPNATTSSETWNIETWGFSEQ